VVKRLPKAVRISHQLGYAIGGCYTSAEAYRDSSPPPIYLFERGGRRIQLACGPGHLSLESSTWVSGDVRPVHALPGLLSRMSLAGLLLFHVGSEIALSSCSPGSIEICIARFSAQR